MQLTYRGQSYTPVNPSVKMAETGLTATYRGATYPLQSADSLNLRSLPGLTYRGVPYGRGTQLTNSPVTGGNLTPSFG